MSHNTKIMKEYKPDTDLKDLVNNFTSELLDEVKYCRHNPEKDCQCEVCLSVKYVKRKHEVHTK